MSTPTLTADRYVLTGLGQHTLIFPDYYILEVAVFDRNLVMRLPFYGPGIVGVIQHQGKIVPLISLRHLYLKEQNVLLPGMLTVVRLTKSLPEFFGLGLVVDRVLASLSREQLAQSWTGGYLPIEEILPQLSGSHWLPQRWYTLET